MFSTKASNTRSAPGFVDQDPFLTAGTRQAKTANAKNAGTFKTASKHEPPPERRGFLFQCKSLGTLIFVPWLLFVSCACAVGLTLYTLPAIGVFVVAACCLLAGALIYIGTKSKLPMYKYAGCLGLLGVFLGVMLGFAVDGFFFSQYFSIKTKRTYTNLLPTQSAAGHSDAGLIGFAEHAKIAQSFVLGRLEDGTNFCVAPILDDSQSARANFFAAGTGCCQARSNFRCDDALSRVASSGVVILKDNVLYNSYFRAAIQAAAVYKLTIPAEGPVFVRWVEDPVKARHNLLRDGFGYLGFNAIFFFLIVTVIASVLHWNTRRETKSYAKFDQMYSHA